MLSLLPGNARGDLERHADAVSLLAHTPKFWATDCADFYEWTEDASRRLFEKRGIVANDDTLFNAFEFVCLVLTRHVDTNPEVRRVSGLRHRAMWIFLALVLLVGGGAVLLYVFLR
jgi:hypothetical protein